MFYKKPNSPPILSSMLLHEGSTETKGSIVYVLTKRWHWYLKPYALVEIKKKNKMLHTVLGACAGDGDY